MEDYKKIELLVSVAKLYYENNYDQSKIAEKLKVSRPYVSKLLSEAKEQGIVTIKVNDPTQVESQLERKIRQRFQLRKVIVVPQTLGESTLSQIGRMGARYLDSIIEKDSIIGFSWGTTLYSCSQYAIARDDLGKIISVQLCGGFSKLEKNTYAVEIIKNFSDALLGTPYMLPLPAVVDDIKLKKSMLRDHNIHRVMEYGKKANISMFTMGAFGRRSALANAGYIGDEQLEQLSAAGAVGDICSHIIDIHGQVCDVELDSRTIAVSLEDIKKKDYRIGVAAGVHKVDCICGALNGGYINVLITDEETAKNVLDRLEGLDRK